MPIYTACEENLNIIRKETGKISIECPVINAVKAMGYTNPLDIVTMLGELGCPDEDCSCELNRLYIL